MNIPGLLIKITAANPRSTNLGNSFLVSMDGRSEPRFLTLDIY